MLDGKEVLIVEEDPVTAVVLRGMLLKLGAAAVVRQEAGSAWDALCARHFDLVFLDLCLRDSDGEALLRRLRAGAGTALPHASTPVVVITGRHDIDSRVRLLDAGADHFFMKPFDLRELEALLRAVFRRHAAAVPSTDSGGLELDGAQRACSYRGRPIALTHAEFDILLCLARSYPQAVPAAGLLRDAGPDAPGAVAVHVHIHHLRHKLAPVAIETVGGVGYRLADGQLAGSGGQRLAA
jgi:DNA-binding response OmpR family regulator